MNFFTLNKIYYKLIQQKTNLSNPLEEYIVNEKNLNKPPLKKMDYVYSIFKHNTGSLLDIGCNDGFFMRNYDWKFENMVGIDIYNINDFTKGKFKQNMDFFTKNGRIKYLNAFFEDYKFEEQFDFIYAGDIVEHVLDVRKFLDKLYSLIKSEGSFCIATPNDIGGDHPEHNRQFNYESLNSLLKTYFLNFKIYILKMPTGSWDFLIAYGIK